MCFRDAARERRARRVEASPNGRKDITDPMVAVTNTLEQFTNQLAKKNQIKATANQIKAVTVGLRTDPQKREDLMARLSELQ